MQLEFLALNLILFDSHGSRLDVGTVQDPVTSAFDQAALDFGGEGDDVPAFREHREIVVPVQDRRFSNLGRLSRSPLIFQHVLNRTGHLRIEVRFADVHLGTIGVPQRSLWGERRVVVLLGMLAVIESSLLREIELLRLL